MFKLLRFFLVWIIFTSVILAQTIRPKIGVALSGGGAKGFAHVEVLKDIEEAGIKIDYISGTSMGAIVAGLYAAGYTPDELSVIMHDLDFTSLLLEEKNRLNISFFDKSYKEKYILNIPIKKFKVQLPGGISKGQGTLIFLESLLSHVHNVNDYSKLITPFVCIATNLQTGNREVMDKGFLPLSILASGSYPTLIEPVKIGDSLYVDGGITNNFPVSELRKRGMDIIIGVDLSTGLATDKSELTSAPKIIEQIISYNIDKNTRRERRGVDLLIHPDLTGYTVTDFEKVDSILARGRKAVEKVRPELLEIAKKQGLSFEESKREITKKAFESLVFDSIDVANNHKYSDEYLIKKMDLKTNEKIEIKTINNAIDALYSTGKFDKIYYKIDTLGDLRYSLTINVEEKENLNSLKFGLHYDDVFKTGLLANITLNEIMIQNSTLSFDAVIGDYPRLNLNYFINNGVKPGLGMNSSYRSVHFNYTENTTLSSFNYRLNYFNYQIYLQSTIKERYAIGIGPEYSYIWAKSTDNNVNYKLMENYYFNSIFYIRADTRNNSNFPSSGIHFNAVARHLIASNVEDFKSALFLSGKFGFSIPISKRLFIENVAKIGVSFDNKTLAYRYFLGGYFEQSMLNFHKFEGVKFSSLSGNHFLSFYTSLNHRFLKKHYLNIYANLANVEEKFEDIRYFRFGNTVFGTSYGYDSPFGPIKFVYSYSPSDKSGRLNLALGYWF